MHVIYTFLPVRASIFHFAWQQRRTRAELYPSCWPAGCCQFPDLPIPLTPITETERIIIQIKIYFMCIFITKVQMQMQKNKINKLYCLFSFKIILIVHKSVVLNHTKKKKKKCMTKVSKQNWFNNNNNNYYCNNSNKCEFVFSQSFEFRL